MKKITSVEIIMTKGLPASGKSTWAKDIVDRNIGKYKRVSKDSLRLMLDNNKWSKDNERFVLNLRDTIVVETLSKGLNIIVDDTNLAPVHEIRLRELAKECSAQFTIKEFTDVSLEECIKRDQKRENYVGEKVIRDMYKQFLAPEIKPVIFDEKLLSCIICDLDGTLALFPGKNPYERDFENDQLNEPVAEVVHKFATTGVLVVYFSGRSDKHRKKTEEWLKKNNLLYSVPYMREGEDKRKDSIIKKELYEKYVKGKYNVLFILDDRNQVVDLWRSLSLTCLQVAEGNF